MEEMEIRFVRNCYNDRHFGNDKIEIGNICWIIIQDNEGLQEYPVLVVKNK